MPRDPTFPVFPPTDAEIRQNRISGTHPTSLLAGGRGDHYVKHRTCRATGQPIKVLVNAPDTVVEEHREQIADGLVELEFTRKPRKARRPPAA